MRIKRILVFLIIFIFSLNNNAQKKRKFVKSSRWQNLYNWKGEYKRLGLQFNVGLTYTLTRIDKQINERGTDTLIQNTRDPKGDFGYYIECGMVHIPKWKQKILSYWDWGLGVKHFSGKETTEEFRTVDFNTEKIKHNYGSWYNGYAFARASLHNIIQINNYNFIDNSIGVNADYNIYGKSTQNGTSILQQSFQSKLRVAINYTLGWGIKIKNGFFILPQISVPVLNMYEWDQGNPSIRWFSSRFMPIMATVKFSWLFKKDPNRCPPVYKNSKDAEINKKYRQTGGK